ncbi:MAG: VOC family protein [Acidimicrobiia bacterium]|nr:VOC family protein [Acidimicrobiia bacterium]
MMRFNHMELTFAPGTLTEEFRDRVRSFYGEVFGWVCRDTEILGQNALLMLLDERATQFILLAESPEPMSSPGYDHLGLLQPSRAEVDELCERIRTRQQAEPEIRLKVYEDLVNPSSTVHAFYVKHLLPIWFDVQSIEYTEPPVRDWNYG